MPMDPRVTIEAQRDEIPLHHCRSGYVIVCDGPLSGPRHYLTAGGRCGFSKDSCFKLAERIRRAESGKAGSMLTKRDHGSRSDKLRRRQFRA